VCHEQRFLHHCKEGLNMHRIMKCSAVATLLFAAAIPALAGPVLFFGPTPYLSAADIPFGFYAGNSPALLETLEDGRLDDSLLGTGGEGVRSTGSALSDSVDADDGLIDGTCAGRLGRPCASWVSHDPATPASATFSFVGTGPLPTAFGLVWTDGDGDITFSATGANGQSLGSFDASGFADRFNGGTTGEDRFFGVQFDGGIRAITITETTPRDGGSFFIEVDHIQYGQMPDPAVTLPEPGSLLLSLLALTGLAVRQRSGRKLPRN
jgi:hypothetical protein